MASPDYFVVQHHDKEAFEIAVTQNLKSGWKLVGGLFMAAFASHPDDPVRLHYCQAITKGGKSA